MFKQLLNRLGYISKEEAESIALARARESVAQIEALKPGDEIIYASAVIRKYGFRIVYALGDGNAKQNSIRLYKAIAYQAAPIDKVKFADQLLPNVKTVDDITLLR